MALTLVNNLVHETSTSTGTGNFTLVNANGRQSFNSAFGTGGSNAFAYYIMNQSAVEWEFGLGHLSASNTLVRDTVLGSSSAGAAVNFSAGTKDVTHDVPANNQVRNESGVTRLGLADSATPVAQTLEVQNAIGNNVNGADFAIKGSAGTGTGVGGNISFYTAFQGVASPDLQNTFSEIMRIHQSGTNFYGTFNISRDGLGFQTVRDLSSNALGIGNQVSGNNAPESSMTFLRYSSGTFGPLLVLAKSKSDTTGTQTVIANNDGLGQLTFNGSDGTEFQPFAAISAFVDGTPGTGDAPGRLAFFTTADGAATTTERMRINSSGRIAVGSLIGYTVFDLGTFTPVFQMNGDTGSTTSFGITRYTNGGGGAPAIWLGVSRGATVGDYTVVQSGDVPGQINFMGADGNGSMVRAAKISAAIDGTPGSSDMPGRLIFATTADGASDSGERMRIDSVGSVNIGNAGANFTLQGSPTWLQVSTNAQTFWAGNFHTYGNHAFGADFLFSKTRNASVSSHTVVNSGDRVMNLEGMGSDGTNFITLARIRFTVDGTPGTNDMPGRIEFQTTPDGSQTALERMRIDSSGRLTIGGGANVTNAIIETNFSSTPWGMTQSSFGGGTNGLLFQSSRHATVGSHTVVNSGDTLMLLVGAGSDGTNFIRAGEIRIVSDGTPGTNDMPGRIGFFTTADGASSVTERMRIDNAGKIWVNASVSTNYSLDSAVGNLNIATDGNTTNSLQIVSYGNHQWSGSTQVAKTRGSDPGTLTVVQANDYLFMLKAHGADGSVYQPAAAMHIRVDGTPGSGDMPGRFEFLTSPDGSATPTERMRIANTGYIYMGRYTNTFGSGGILNIAANTNIDDSANFVGFGNTQFGPNININLTRATDPSTHTIVASGDGFGYINFGGSDGTNFERGAMVYAEVDGTPGNNSMPGRLMFGTTPSGSGSAGTLERMRIDNKGNVVINTAALSTSATDGFLYIPSSAGTPTGTPTSYTGRVPIEVDTTNSRLYGYFGGSWVNLTGSGGGGGSPGGSNFQIQYRIDGSTFGGFGEWNPDIGVMSIYRSPTVSPDVSNPAQIEIYNRYDTVTISPDLPGVYEKGFIGWQESSNQFAIGTIGGGGGLQRDFIIMTQSTERVRVDNTGKTTVGGHEAFGIDGYSRFQVIEAGSLWHQSWMKFGNDSAGVSNLYYKTRGATLDTNGAVQLDDTLGDMWFYGNTGNFGIPAAQIAVKVDGAITGSPDVNQMPGRIQFATTVAGGSSPTERLRIDSAGHVILGGTASQTGHWSGQGLLQTVSDSTWPAVGLFHFEASGTGPGISFHKSRSGTKGTKALISSGDNLGQIWFAGSDATQWLVGGGLACYVEGTPASNNLAAGLYFYTTPPADNSYERMRIDRLGRLIMAYDTFAGYAGSVAGEHLQMHTREGVTNMGLYMYCDPATTSPDLIQSAQLTLARSRHGNVGSHTIVQDTDIIGRLNFAGSDGSVFRNMAQIDVVADGSQGTSSPDLPNNPGRIVFRTAQRNTGLFGASGVPLEAMRIDHNQCVTIASNLVSVDAYDPVSIDSTASRLQVITTNNEWPQSWVGIGNTATGPYNAFAKTRGSSPSTQTIVQDGDYLMDFWIYGSDGTQFKRAARFGAQVDGTPGTNDMPGRFVFHTCTDGTATLTERMRINNRGTVAIGTQGAPIQLDLTDSRVQIAQGGEWGISLIANRASASGAAILLVKSRNTTFNSNTIVQNGDNVGEITFAADDGVNYTNYVAGIYAQIDGTPGTDDVPGRLVFHTTADGAAATTERFRIDNAGRVIVREGGGTAVSDFDNFGTSPAFQVLGLTSSTAVIGVSRYANGTGGSKLYFGKSRGTSVGSNTVVQSGDDIGILMFQGADGTSLQPAAQIVASVDGTPGTNDMPGRLTFWTSTDGGTTLTERLRVDNKGNIIAATPFAAALSTSATDGFLYIQSTGGTPTGVPTPYYNVSPDIGGPVPLVVDYSNNRLYAFYGSAWHNLTGTGGGGSPGGSDTQIQFNDGGSFGGDSAFTWNKTTNTLTIAQGTITDPALVLDLSSTWNDAADTFTGLKFNVTRTAAADASKLVDFQIDGTSWFKTNSEGTAIFNQVYTAIGTSCIVFQSNATNRASIDGSGTFNSYAATGNFILQGQNSGSGINLGAGRVWLFDQANYTLALGQGANAHTFRVYNTTDSVSGTPTNYERGTIGWSGNVFVIGNESGGSGSSRKTKLIGHGGATSLWLNSPFNGDMVWNSSDGSSDGHVHFDANTGPTIRHKAAGLFAWASSTNPMASTDTALGRNAAGVIEVNNGTAGTYRDLKLRSTIFSQGAGNEVTLGKLEGSHTLAIYANPSTSPDVSNPAGIRVFNRYDAQNQASPDQPGVWEAGVFDWTTTADVLTIGTQAGGTGTARQVTIHAAGTNNLIDLKAGTTVYARISDSAGAIDFGTTKLGWGSGIGLGFDLGLARNAAGVMEVNNGTAGTYRDLQVRNLFATIDDSTNSTVLNNLTLTRTTTQGPANGIGVSMAFDVEAVNVSPDMNLNLRLATIAASATGIGTSPDTTDGLLTFNVMADAQTAVERMRIDSTGLVTIGLFDSTGGNTVDTRLALTKQISSAAGPSDGIGVGIAFDVESVNVSPDMNLNLRVATISAVATGISTSPDVTDGEIVFSTMLNTAAAAERLRITSTGVNPSVRILENRVTLTDAATVSLDASAGNTFKLLAGGNRTIDVPTNKPASGKAQKIVIAHEASGADRTLSLTTGSAGAFRFGTDITALTATTNGLVDYIGCIYNESDDRWDVVSYVKGY